MSDCVFERVGDSAIGSLYRCAVCGLCWTSAENEPGRLHIICYGEKRYQSCDDHGHRPARASVPVPPYGPGTELHADLAEFGFDIRASCSCPARMDAMNRWGPDGCRANRKTIIGWLQDEAQRSGITASIPDDEKPQFFAAIGMMLDAAINRAEQKLPATD